MVDSKKCRMPVKIQRVTYTSDGEKIIMNDMTKISVPGQTEHSFQFKESLPSHTQPLSIEDILCRLTEWDNRDLQIRLRLRLRVFQCVPGAHARLRKTVTSTRSVLKISSPS